MIIEVSKCKYIYKRFLNPNIFLPLNRDIFSPP